MNIEVLEQFILDFERAGLSNTEINFVDFYPHGDSWNDCPMIEVFINEPRRVYKWKESTSSFESFPTDVNMEKADCFSIHDFERILEGTDMLGYPDCGLDSCYKIDGTLVMDDWESENRFKWDEKTDRVRQVRI